MKYSVDRIIDNIAVLENIDTKEKKEINIDFLPENIYEKCILNYENFNYQLDKEEELKREERIKEKLHKLQNLE